MSMLRDRGDVQPLGGLTCQGRPGGHCIPLTQNAFNLCIHMMQGLKVMWVAAGPAAFHSVIGTEDGRCFTWGRNEVLVLPRKLWNAAVSIVMVAHSPVAMGDNARVCVAFMAELRSPAHH